MHLLYCDESNMHERPRDFLIYGGLAVSDESALALSQTLDRIRNRFDIPHDFRLKFNPGPDNLSHSEFSQLKQEIIEAAVACEAKLVIYVILHDIATNPDDARRNGINAVCYHFDCLLNRWGTPGLVLIDRFNDQGNQIDSHLKEKFSVGLRGMPYSDEIRLNNIIGFHYSAIGQSHIPSVVDIVLGSLRFALNTKTRELSQHNESADTILKLLGPLFFREGGTSVSELSFQFSPKVIKSEMYREQYQALKDFLSAAGIDTAQPITAQRIY